MRQQNVHVPESLLPTYRYMNDISRKISLNKLKTKNLLKRNSTLIHYIVKFNDIQNFNWKPFSIEILVLFNAKLKLKCKKLTWTVCM